jgi:DNA modification methylase
MSSVIKAVPHSSSISLASKQRARKGRKRKATVQPISAFDICLGDVLEQLKQYPDNYFDASFADPPYGLSFMGTDWDHGVPSVEVWKELYRVLKPGASILMFGRTKTYHGQASAIEDAGF